MNKLKKNVAGWTFLLIFMTIATTAVRAEDDPCEIPPGDYRTQTQGGWQNDCHGGNPGCILQNNFAAVFPSGITIGGGYTMHFTSAAAVRNYLPATETPSMLTGDLVDPTTTPSGVFGGQVLALKINVAFSDAAVAGFPTGLGNLVILNGVHTPAGAFSGWTVYQILALANQVLGGDISGLPAGISISDLNGVVDAINNNFDNGTVSQGYLVEHDCGDTPLPVEISSFEAIADGDVITVRWQTASESRVASYELSRSNGTDSWQTITVVGGLGDSPTGHDYSYADRHVAEGVIYSYRLAIHDLDGGTAVYAQIASASLQQSVSPTEYALYQNYPNPFNPTTTIAFDLSEASSVRLSVFDLLGREVRILLNGEMASGNHTVMLDASGMAGGSYFYRLEAGTFTAVRRLMLIK